MVASGAITVTLDAITSLSCIAVLLASPIGGALLVCARARYLPALCPSREHSQVRLRHPTRASHVERCPTPRGCVERRARCRRPSPLPGNISRKFHTIWVCRAGPTAGDGACNLAQGHNLLRLREAS